MTQTNQVILYHTATDAHTPTLGVLYTGDHRTPYALIVHGAQTTLASILDDELSDQIAFNPTTQPVRLSPSVSYRVFQWGDDAHD